MVGHGKILKEGHVKIYVGHRQGSLSEVPSLMFLASEVCREAIQF